MTFEFDLILGSFLSYGVLMGWFGSWTTVLGSTHVVEQLSFSLFLLILTLELT